MQISIFRLRIWVVLVRFQLLLGPTNDGLSSLRFSYSSIPLHSYTVTYVALGPDSATKDSSSLSCTLECRCLLLSI